ncbi:hypothetical protein LOTGIDRAFT_116619 [Lottia gigantea]|uniref:Ubiquitin-like modifier-activating enzyme ATG7 n=1 Tax=Lottia gigantea TaxID=225164 RepID=V4AQA5_LOTGI|nr:hypothetical protein LOTGIDRAFT_116619 [Lottia gigantea]ESO95826.1 hypothetical protein LOTGIDRAFT_116619 [Lottia gigantea]
MESLQFAPFSSGLDAGFWPKLSEKKLNEYALDESSKDISGFYYNGDIRNQNPILNVDYTCFDRLFKTPARSFISHGVLYLKNTIEGFKECDKKLLLEEKANQIWQDIKTGKAVEDPTLLSRFILLAYADLKKYHYYYWFAFPALIYNEHSADNYREQGLFMKFIMINVKLGKKLLTSFLNIYKKFQRNLTLNSIVNKFSKFSGVFFMVIIAFSFCDPCTLENHPGWPLRNFLLLIAYTWADKLETCNILCFRDKSRDGKREISHSLMLNVQLPKLDKETCPKCVGWEKNEKQKLGPRMVNLSATMDPSRLCASAVDLNLKLMRWRLLPDLDLDKISSTKCLLLGSGTLGCNVARCLMGWGVKNITLVDNSKVSYSNPVRQSLFIFQDCLNGGKAKAEAAANSMRQIFPGVNALGLSLSIPMPGHAITGIFYFSPAVLVQTKKDIETLEDLIDKHDAVFLLMDTRESRWLPTLLGAVKQKIVINAALGFDTYLVLRHGYKSDTGVDGTKIKLGEVIPGDQLGCYFCNDVVAPGDSTRDRSLDQQCTVTRPGISMIGSALAVELLMSVLQHPLGFNFFQIRGFLSRFSSVLPASHAFDKCTACSQIVMETYKKEGFEFLVKVFNEPSYLENLTGLTAMHEGTFDVEVWDLSDEEDFSNKEEL